MILSGQRRWAGAIAAAAAGVMLALLPAGSASADSVDVSEWVGGREGNPYCLLAGTGIGMNPSLPSAMVVYTSATAYAPSGGPDDQHLYCDGSNGTTTAYSIGVRWRLYVWRDGWELCRRTRDIQEDNTTSTVAQRTYTSPPCGAGYYRTEGDAYRWTGSEWRGGSMTSPYTYVPSS